MDDLIGKLLDGYTAIEKAKIEARMQASRDQTQAYDLPYRYANPQASSQDSGAASKWLPLAGIVLLGVLVYSVAVK